MSVKKAGKLYETFSDFEPKSVAASPMNMPKTAVLVGKMIAVMYASDKWEKKVNYYKHEHEAGVNIYHPGGGTAVPGHIANAEALTKLGRCIGATFIEDGEEVNVTFPGCNLYATPSGRGLVIVHNMRRVEALIWGGKLRVEAEGIKG
jgi:hypothetical protein